MMMIMLMIVPGKQMIDQKPNGEFKFESGRVDGVVFITVPFSSWREWMKAEKVPFWELLMNLLFAETFKQDFLKKFSFFSSWLILHLFFK